VSPGRTVRGKIELSGHCRESQLVGCRVQSSELEGGGGALRVWGSVSRDEQLRVGGGSRDTGADDRS